MVHDLLVMNVHSYGVIHKNIHLSRVIMNCLKIYLKNNVYNLHFFLNKNSYLFTQNSEVLCDWED